MEAELKEVLPVQQLKLFSDNYCGQLTHNTDKSQRRTVRTLEETEAGQETIRDRYADPKSRLFSVAVTFRAPECYS